MYFLKICSVVLNWLRVHYINDYMHGYKIKLNRVRNYFKWRWLMLNCRCNSYFIKFLLMCFKNFFFISDLTQYSGPESSKLSIGIAVGVALSLFIICVITSILIIRWGIQKGYLRHISRSYKSFRNPDSSIVTYDRETVNNQDEMNVHI